MKRILLALAIMAMTLSVGAQTTKKSTTKKTTTTATAQRKTTTTTKKKTTAKSTAARKSSTTTKKKTTVTTPKKTTTTTTTTTTTKQPTGTVLKEKQSETTTTYRELQGSTQQTGRQLTQRPAIKGWNEVYHYLGGAFVTARDYDEDGDYAKTSGSCFQFTTGINHAFPLTKSIPLYLRAGGSVTYAVGSKNMLEFGDVEEEISHMSQSHQMKELYDLTAYTVYANINVDCGYKIPIAGGKMSIMPYMGGDLKINVLAKANMGGEKYNLFEAEDMEDLFMTDIEKGMSRIQGGFHFGADFYAIRHLVVGMEAQFLTPLCNYKYTEDGYTAGFKISESAFYVKAGFVW